MAIKFTKAGEQQLLLLFLDQLDKETDRGCALVAGGYLEKQLENVLKARMLKHGAIKDLFEGQGALATFSAKIKLAFALGVISNEVYLDLDRIRNIRNAFAHNLQAKRFDQTEISVECGLLQNVLAALNVSSNHSAARKKFIRCVMAISLILEFCLVRSTRPKADRQEELDTLTHWISVLDA